MVSLPGPASSTSRGLRSLPLMRALMSGISWDSSSSVPLHVACQTRVTADIILMHRQVPSVSSRKGPQYNETRHYSSPSPPGWKMRAFAANGCRIILAFALFYPSGTSRAAGRDLVS